MSHNRKDSIPKRMLINLPTINFCGAIAVKHSASERKNLPQKSSEFVIQPGGAPLKSYALSSLSDSGRSLLRPRVEKHQRQGAHGRRGRRSPRLKHNR